MNSKEKVLISVQTVVDSPVKEVWKRWTTPEDIVKWNYALDTWHTTKSENDLRVGGRFSSRMEARDGSAGFDFGGIYTNIIEYGFISYILDDGRTVSITFSEMGNITGIVETFEAEIFNNPEMQRNGWQAILDNFKKYTESVKGQTNLI